MGFLFANLFSDSFDIYFFGDLIYRPSTGTSGPSQFFFLDFLQPNHFTGSVSVRYDWPRLRS